MNPELNITEEELASIEGYLRGTIAAVERESFEQRVASDANWAAKVQEVRLLLTGIAEAGLEERLAVYNQSMPGRVEALPVTRKFNRRAVLTIAASVCAMVIAAWLLFAPSRGERLYTNFYRPDPGLPTVMNTSADYAFDKAMVDYKRGDYEKAIGGWRALLVTRPSSDTLNYFIACALQAKGDISASLPVFDKVIATAGSSFKKDAYWFKGLALLKLGRRPEAAEAIGKSDHDGAAEILKKLR